MFGLERLGSPEGRVLEERFQELRSVYLCCVSHTAGEVSGQMEREGEKDRKSDLMREL